MIYGRGHKHPSHCLTDCCNASAWESFGKQADARGFMALLERHGKSTCGAKSRAAQKRGYLEHFPLMLIHSLRGGRNWRILVDKLYEGANEFCARGPVSFAQPLFAAVL